ncbi:MAG: hypothetical protein HZB91_05050 [Elusimicrobia bacterium]|nr:hypothetical protein [Elusimicrobiota bacterium]
MTGKGVVRASCLLAFFIGASSAGAVQEAEDADSLPVTLGPEYNDIALQLAAANGRAYAPKVERKVIGRVREILSVDQNMPQGAGPRGLAIVREKSSKPALQELLETEHPDMRFLKEPGYRLILTVPEHLKAVKKNLDWVDHHVGRKGYWKVDLADVRRRVVDDLEGVDAVVYLYRPAESRPASESHQGPAPKLAAPRSEDWRRDMLSEMWQRRILGPDMNQPSPDDERVLGLVRKAEAAGAVEDLRAKGLPLAGLMVEARLAGDPAKRSMLTKEGYDRWVFLRSQDAVAFFERKGVDAKWVFKLRDMDGKPLFVAGGFLTEAGDKVYRRASLGMAMFWMLPSGEVMGTRPPPQRAQPAPTALPSAAAPPATGPAAGVPGTPPQGGGAPGE